MYMATHSNILAWRIPWTDDTGRLLSLGCRELNTTERLCITGSLCCIPEISKTLLINYQFSSVQLLSCVRLFATPWTAALQASLSITNSRSLLTLMSIEPVMPSNHLILCPPLLLPLSIFPSIRVFSDESVLCIKWPKYWSFSFSISPANEHSGLISFRMDWLDLLTVQGTFYTT